MLIWVDADYFEAATATSRKMYCRWERVRRGGMVWTSERAAAWHLNCDMSWDELKQKRTDAILEVHSKLVFTAEEISEAIAAVKKVEEETGKPQRDAGGSLSLNR